MTNQATPREKTSPLPAAAALAGFPISGFGFRVSDFLRPSAFGFRVSHARAPGRGPRPVDRPAFLHHFCTISASLSPPCFLQSSPYQALPVFPLPAWCNSAPPGSMRQMGRAFLPMRAVPSRPPSRPRLSSRGRISPPPRMPPPCPRQGQSNPIKANQT